MSGPRSGRCLCGSVSFQAAEVACEVHVCHCENCQRWTGGPEYGVDSGDDVTFDHPELIATHQSSVWAERGFCTRCGTALFYRTLPGGIYTMPCGVFDDQTGFRLVEEIFVDRRPAWMAAEPDCRQVTGAEWLAANGYAGEATQ